MNDKIQENIDNSYLFGCIKHRNGFKFYLMPIAYWILNYAKYDPAYNPNDWKDGDVFRDNILCVDDDNIEQFIQSIEVDRIDLSAINSKQYNFNDIFCFFIDFDSKTFVNYFDDIEVEEYLPNEQWVGEFNDPMKYLPIELQDKFL